MHQQYYDTHTRTVHTWQQQAAPSERFPYGLGLNDDSYVASLGVYPYREHYEEFDKLTQKLVPDDAPSIENGEAVQYYRAVSLAPDVAIAEGKAEAKTRATERRWEVETGGVSLPDGSGTRVATTIDDQNRIASALQGMADAGIAEVDFKAESGWTRLSREQLAGVAALIAAHVQGCFSRERTLHEAIDAADSIEELTAIDINAGWPGQVPEVPDPAPVSEQAPEAA